MFGGLTKAFRGLQTFPMPLICRFVKLTETEELDLEHLESLLTPRTKLVALPHMSNTLGFVTDVGRVVDLAGRVGAKVLLDACQSVPNRPVDVKALGVDFLVASGHKMCGPTGIGFLWSRCVQRGWGVSGVSTRCDSDNRAST